MNLKASQRGFKKEKFESKLLCSLLSKKFIVAFGLNKKVSCGRLLRERDKALFNLFFAMMMQSWMVEF